MARKTLGKMEFADLIKNLQDQNSSQLDAQKETTKSIRNLTAYFLKQDRAEARRRLEDQMEERSAVQVSGDGSKKGKGFSAKLPRKGLLGAFADFLMTGILGAKGAGIFRGLFSSLRFAPGALMKFGRLLGAALLVPDLANAFSEAFKEDSLSDGLKTFIKSFFGKKEGQSFAETMMSNVSKGGLLGFAAFGPKGAVVGAILGGAFTALDETLGLDKTIELGTYLKDYLFGATGFAMLGGAALLKSRFFTANLYKSGFKGLARMGPSGFLGMALVGATLSSLSKTLNGDGPEGLSDTLWTTLFGSSYAGGFSIAEGAFYGGAIAKMFGFGLPGLILGASVGLAFKNADDAMRRDMGKGLGEALYDAFSNFWGYLNDLVSSWLGNKKAEARLAMAEYREKKLGLLSDLTSNMSLLEKGKIREDIFGELMQRTKQRRPDVKDDDEIRRLTSMSTGDAEVEAMVNLEMIKRMFAGNMGLFNEIFKGKPGQDMSIDYEKLYAVLQQGALRRNLQIDKSAFFSTDMGDILESIQDLTNLESKYQIKSMPSDPGNSPKIRQQFLGATRYDKPTLTVVGDTPSQGEMIFTDRQFERMASAIATQKENQTMTSMIPIMMGQGGGGTSMPVINNSYSYQNTENTVREMPTTSSLNMMTALA